MSGPDGSDPYGVPPGEVGRPRANEPTRAFPPQQGYPPRPQYPYAPAPGPTYPPPYQGGYGEQSVYGTPPGPGGPGGPPKRNLGPWLGGGAAVLVLIGVGLILFFTVGQHSDTPAAEATTTAAPSTTSATKATVVPPLPSSLSTSTKASATPTTSATPPTTSGAAAVPANVEQARQITTLGKALVDGISKGDTAALAKVTCGTLASKLGSGPNQPDPTVYDHVANITVSPDGSAGSVDVFAYTVKSGPPANSVTFLVQKQGSAWKACDIKS